MIVTLFKIILLFPLTLVLSLIALFSIPFQKSGRLYHWCARSWSKSILKIYGVHVTVKGLELSDRSRHYIYVTNHASMFDIPAVLAGIPDQIRIVLKKELTRVPIWGWALKYGHYISIDRSNPKDAMASLERAAETIRRGASVLLFAEGTRTRNGKLQPFKRGAFTLAAKSGVPIIPITINGTFKILPKGSWRIRPTDITVVLDKPIDTQGIEGKGGEMDLMEKVHRIMESHYIEQSLD